MRNWKSISVVAGICFLLLAAWPDCAPVGISQAAEAEGVAQLASQEGALPEARSIDTGDNAWRAGTR